jgi:hypothetical protein
MCRSLAGRNMGALARSSSSNRDVWYKIWFVRSGPSLTQKQGRKDATLSSRPNLSLPVSPSFVDEMNLRGIMHTPSHHTIYRACPKLTTPTRRSTVPLGGPRLASLPLSTSIEMKYVCVVVVVLAFILQLVSSRPPLDRTQDQVTLTTSTCLMCSNWLGG